MMSALKKTLRVVLARSTPAVEERTAVAHAKHRKACLCQWRFQKSAIEMAIHGDTESTGESVTD